MTFMSPFLRGAVRQLEKGERGYQGRITYTIPTSSCTKPFECTIGVADVMGSLIKMSIDGGPVVFPKDKNLVFNLSLVYHRQMCESCRTKLTSIFNKCSADLWDKLPTSLNLPAWDMIKDFEV